MPISKNQSKTKLRKNFNNKKSKKPKLKLTKLSGGAGLSFSRSTENTKNLFNNITGIDLPNLKVKIRKTESFLQYLKDYKTYLKNRNTPPQQGRFSKLFGIPPQSPRVPPRVPILLKSRLNLPKDIKVQSNQAKSEHIYEVPVPEPVSVPVPEALYEKDLPLPVPGFSGNQVFSHPKIFEREEDPRLSTHEILFKTQLEKTRYNNLKNFINSRNSITFCDCKIILLYIYVFNLKPIENNYIKTYLIQPSVKNTTTKTNLQVNPFAAKKYYNIDLINFTLNILAALLINIIIVYKNILSCSDFEFKTYLLEKIDKYKILFDTKTDQEYNIIVNNLLQIFKKGGDINEKFDLKILETMNPFIFKEEETYYSNVKGDGGEEENYELLGEGETPA
jgi:hypothetical protein